MELVAGARVTDRIVLQKRLGEGAMGTVWQANHAGLNADVAVKFLFAHAAKENPRLLQRFRSEASVAANIRSPYVVQMLDYGVTDDGRPYLVMEKLEGEPLDVLLARRGPLPVEEVCRVVKHVCKALSKAHAMGVVHRDIKPANLFNVGGDDLFIKVLDFGIAKQVVLEGNGVTLAGEVTGTPAYMSPEQLADSKDVDARTDIWALGVVVYQLLTGRRPFDSTSLTDLYVAVCSGSYQPVSRWRPALPRQLEAWFGRVLDVDRDSRLQSADEMAREFVAAAASANPAASPNAAAADGARTRTSIHDAAELAALPPHTVRLDPGDATAAAGTIGHGTTMSTAAAISTATVPRGPAPVADMHASASAAAGTLASALGPLDRENPTVPPLATVPKVMATHATPIATSRPKRSRALWWAGAATLLTLGAAGAFAVQRHDAAPNLAPAPGTVAPTSTPARAQVPPLEPTAPTSNATTARQEAAANASASATSPSAAPQATVPRPPTRATTPATTALASPPPVTAPPPPVPPPIVTKPNCQGDNAYSVDANGHLIPKPACM